MSFAAIDDGRPPSLVVGLGNPILGDDGVGWRIVDALEDRLGLDTLLRDAVGPLEVDRLAVGGLQLMERLVGYERVVLADATVDGRRLGTVQAGPLSNAGDRPSAHLDSAHDTTLPRAIELAHALGARTPSDVSVVSITVERLGDFGESLSPEVEAAVASAVDAILGLLARTRRTAR